MAFDTVPAVLKMIYSLISPKNKNSAREISQKCTRIYDLMTNCVECIECIRYIRYIGDIIDILDIFAHDSMLCNFLLSIVTFGGNIDMRISSSEFPSECGDSTQAQLVLIETSSQNARNGLQCRMGVRGVIFPGQNDPN